jgi:hypothetical protein
MLSTESYLPSRAVVAELIRKYDANEEYSRDDIRWMVNVLHALNDDPAYQKSQEENSVEVVSEVKPSVNIAPSDPAD